MSVKIKELKKIFIDLLRACFEIDGKEQIILSGSVLQENGLDDSTFWDVICPLLKKDGVLKDYDNPNSLFSAFESSLLSESEIQEILTRNGLTYDPQADTKFKDSLKTRRTENSKTYRHVFIVDEKKLFKSHNSVPKSPEESSLKPEIKLGNLIAYDDGTIRYKSTILNLRPQIKDLCRLFMNRHNQLVDSDCIKDEIIKATKRKSTSFDTISKYVSELHAELQIHFGKTVITNQPKDGWIFNP
ncbi:MAG: hypothetical protein WCO12_02860 [bacterium]